MSACMAPFPVHAEEALNCKVYQPDPKKHAQCLLLDYKKICKVNPALFADAQVEIKKGDHYFNLKDFDNAYEAYDMAGLSHATPMRIFDKVIPYLRQLRQPKIYY